VKLSLDGGIAVSCEDSWCEESISVSWDNHTTSKSVFY
jgi:hypothetical protein